MLQLLLVYYFSIAILKRVHGGVEKIIVQMREGRS